jgi:hypothetical protein
MCQDCLSNYERMQRSYLRKKWESKLNNHIDTMEGLLKTKTFIASSLVSLQIKFLFFLWITPALAIMEYT